MNDATALRLERFAPLAGLGFAVLAAAGNLVIGSFPDEKSSIAKITSFYAKHHDNVARGGALLAWSGIFLALFAVALVVRLRRGGAPGIAVVAVLVGGGIAALDALLSASTYVTAGKIGADHAVSPQALQAWHISGAVGGGVFAAGSVLLLGLFIAGAVVPGWLRWTGVIIGIAELTPVSFLASLVFLLWTAVAGVVLAARPVAAASAQPGVRAPVATG
jgi:hypothetical protein